MKKKNIDKTIILNRWCDLPELQVGSFDSFLKLSTPYWWWEVSSLKLSLPLLFYLIHQILLFCCTPRTDIPSFCDKKRPTREKVQYYPQNSQAKRRLVLMCFPSFSSLTIHNCTTKTAPCRMCGFWAFDWVEPAVELDGQRMNNPTIQQPAL